jgi:hypothetical protein
VKDLSPGERSGKKFGMRLNTAPIDVEIPEESQHDFSLF